MSALADQLWTMLVAQPGASARQPSCHASVIASASEPDRDRRRACRFPGGVDSLDDFLEHAGVRRRCDRKHPRALGCSDGGPALAHGGFITGIDLFDPAFFGISPREATSMDPQQRIILELVWAALENAAQSIDELRRGTTGVYLGVGANEYGRLIEAAGPKIRDRYALTGNATSLIAGRISHILRLPWPVWWSTRLALPRWSPRTGCESAAPRRERCGTRLGGINLMLSPIATLRSPAWRRCRRADAVRRSTPGPTATFGVKARGVVVLKRLPMPGGTGTACWR